MRKETLQKHTKIANDILYYIYTHIETHIDLEELSRDLKISKFHMHRIFKEMFGQNIYESIKSIRLQKASSLLITNRYSTISEVAAQCGYSSHSSFIKAFKMRFGKSPKRWREGGYKTYSDRLLRRAGIETAKLSEFDGMEPVIEKRPELESYYIRHKGYDSMIKPTWQKLQTWVLDNGVTAYRQIALFHDNPTVTPLEECRYIACIETDEKVRSDRLPKFKIASGIYARFDLQGRHEDLLRFIHWVYHVWLPRSEYETTTKPSYAVYRKNNFLSEDGTFDLSFYIAIRY
ncbi:AraC family transcriptional regulator [Thiomicrolovo sp. ZZH C-3]